MFIPHVPTAIGIGAKSKELVRRKNETPFPTLCAHLWGKEGHAR